VVIGGLGGLVLSGRATADATEAKSVKAKVFAIPGPNIKQLVPAMGAAYATDRIMVEGRRIGYMYREVPDKPLDSGWRFFAGDEDEKYLDDSDHTGIYAVNTVANYDPDIIPYFDAAAPCAFDKVPGTKRYEPVKS
jgi:hypothetical protein